MTTLTNLTKSELVAMVARISAENATLHDEVMRLVDRVAHNTANITHRLYTVETLITELQNPPKKTFLEMVQEYLAR